MQAVAVRAVQLDHVEAEPQAAQGGVDERVLHPLQPDRVERDRRVPPGVVGDRRRRLRRPAAFRLAQNRLAAGRRRRSRPLAAGMRKLHAELGDAVSAAEVMDPLERHLVLVRPHAGAFRRDAAARIDIGHLAHHEARAPQGKAAEMH